MKLPIINCAICKKEFRGIGIVCSKECAIELQKIIGLLITYKEIKKMLGYLK